MHDRLDRPMGGGGVSIARATPPLARSFVHSFIHSFILSFIQTCQGT